MVTMKTPDPSKPSAAYDVMRPRFERIMALLGGTEAMRAASTTYLPRHEAESDRNYEERLARTFLYNSFGRTLNSLVGKPFSKKVVIGDDVPPALEPLEENADGQNNNLHVFARRTFREGVAKGLVHILVEFPKHDVPAETLADERARGALPYFVMIPAENVIAAYHEFINGADQLTHVRIFETETVREGFEERVVERIRVLEPGTWTIWEKKNKKKWTIVEQGMTTLDFIPLVTFYSDLDREDDMVARPPLTDLADLNIAHWQSSSDQTNILTVSRFPILAMSGGQDDEAQIKVGPRRLLTHPNADAKFYYVEHTGQAISAGRQNLEDLKSEMAMLGIELLQRTGNMTATAKAIDSAENTSTLQAIVMSFNDALELCFYYAARWMNLEDGGSITVSTDFGLPLDSQADLVTLLEARREREISHGQFMAELKRRNVIADDFDPEADWALVTQEKDVELQDAILKAKMEQEAGIVAKPEPKLKEKN